VVVVIVVYAGDVGNVTNADGGGDVGISAVVMDVTT
jgi:hypothetical protein